MAKKLRFSANINTFNACADRYVLSGYGKRLTSDQLIQAATRVPGLTGVEVVGLWHVNDDNIDHLDAGQAGDARRRLDQLIAGQALAIAGQDIAVGAGIEGVDVGRKA